MEAIREFCDSRGVSLRLDREKGIIEGVKILGLVSRNGRSYLKEAVARAVSLYEDRPVNIDHGDSPRSYADRIGSIRNVRVEPGDGGLRADLHFNPKHPLAEQLCWDAEHAPGNVGFSHVIEGRVARKNGATIVEEIVKVTSVDLVADPATTRGLFEATATGKDSKLDIHELTEQQLAAENPALLRAIEQRILAEQAESAEAKAKDATIKALTEELDALKARQALADKAAAIEAELTEAKLPAELVTEVFRGVLMQAKDAAERKALLEDRRALLQLGAKPKSKEQHVAEHGGAAFPTAREFISAITE